MSKLYTKYLEKKNINKYKYYLFECGMFYIFIDDDAYKISKYVPFKITKLNENIVKCVFPKNSIDKYMGIFENLELDVEIINNNDKDVINDSSYQEEVNNSKSGWVETNSKKLEILNMFGYDYKDLKKVNIWKDTVL